jgi:dTDP-4-dehydrorhamnose reductase
MTLDIWGGIECTFNRVGDQYFDQCAKNGHLTRTTDFQLFKELGIKKLRYPCIWEKVSMDNPKIRNWEELDEKLGEIKRLGITPIAGFLHHGSGPKYTNLLDPKFPMLFANYARDFAERYPWIEHFTPVNEILTTARFSCLYGHWYPHKKNDLDFLKAVFLQCKATVLAMREIRKVIPYAKLIQTEDIGKCQSTAKLKYQRDFENERRWLAYDILCGKFDQNHKLYKYVMKAGISYEEIHWATENFYTPDVLGINHYLLSNRFLDHKMDLYPEHFHGGNKIDSYADVGVLDTGQANLPLPEDILCEAWSRFKIPLAVTEVHTRGHREEQMRWFYQMWKAGETAQKRGVKLKGITAWSLLGTYDWHSLCTRDDLFYEPGVFDLRSSRSYPRKTGLAKLIYDLAHTCTTTSPLLETRGSWQTERRVLFAAKQGSHSLLHSSGRPLMIAGENLALKKIIARACRFRNLPFVTADVANVEEVTKSANPWAVLNTLTVMNTGSLFLSAQYIESTKHILFQSAIDESSEYFSEFINNALDLIIDGEHGIYHFNELGEIIWANNPESTDEKESIPFHGSTFLENTYNSFNHNQQQI